MKKGLLELRGMRFRAFHGCLEEEKRDGNDFVVDLTAVYDMEAAAGSDSLADAADYSGIYDIVAEQMARPSNLLENVASRICEAVKSGYPQLEYIRVRVAKLNPPLGGPCEQSAVTCAHTTPGARRRRLSSRRSRR